MKNKFYLIIFLALLSFVFAVKGIWAGSATLSWNANTETDFAGYKIYYGTFHRTDICPQGGYENKIDVGKTANPNEPSYTFENLQDGKSYYFSITSYDISGNESCFSDEVKKTIPGVRPLWYQPITDFFQELFTSIKNFFQKIF